MSTVAESKLAFVKYLREFYASILDKADEVKFSDETRWFLLQAQAGRVLEHYFKVEQDLLTFHGVNARGKQVA